MNRDPHAATSDGKFPVLTITPVVCALVLFAGITIWGAWQDVAEAEKSVLAAEGFALKTHADRTAARIEEYLEGHPQANFSTLPNLPWLRAHWDRIFGARPQSFYAALVDLDGMIIRHSNPKYEGLHLEQRWYNKTVQINDLDIAVTESQALIGGNRAYGIQQPIAPQGHVVGYCHVAVDADWIDGLIGRSQGDLVKKWMLIALVILMIIAVACISIIRIVRESAYLKQTVAMQHVQKLSELGRLAGGLAHEIRNPLNAIRLNLFTLRRQLDRNSGDSTSDPALEILRETDQEIERLESLIRSVLGYARPSAAHGASLDAVSEVRSTIRFVERLMEKEGIKVTKDLPRTAITVRIDQDRFRQMLLNLLNNAREVSAQGEIRIGVRRRNGWADIEVTDSGPGVHEEDADKLFEPFYTTKESGTGLGLALVRRYAQEAGGSATCESNNGAGATFRITLPVCQ